MVVVFLHQGAFELHLAGHLRGVRNRWSLDVLEATAMAGQCLAKKLQFVDHSNLGPAWGPCKPWENDHHDFKKGPFFKLHYVRVFGQDRNSNVVQTSWNHQLDRG